MEEDDKTTSYEETYPAWLWRIVDEVDRWAAKRLSMVQGMILEAIGVQALPSRTEEEAKRIAKTRYLAAREYFKKLNISFKTKKAEKNRKKRLAALRDELFPYGKEAATQSLERLSLAEKVAFLACVHDVMIEQDEGRKQRKKWNRIAPPFDNDAEEIVFATYFVIESVPRHKEDRKATGSCQIEDYWHDVREDTSLRSAEAVDLHSSNSEGDSSPAFLTLDEIDPAAYIPKTEARRHYNISETTFERILEDNPKIKRSRAMRLKDGRYKAHKRRLLLHRDDLHSVVKARQGKKDS